jgi:hypothetical protein
MLLAVQIVFSASPPCAQIMTIVKRVPQHPGAFPLLNPRHTGCRQGLADPSRKDVRRNCSGYPLPGTLHAGGTAE